MKAKKWLVFMLAVVMVSGMFTLNVSAFVGVTNPTQEEWYTINLNDVLGDDAFKAASITIDFTGDMMNGGEEPGIYNGATAFSISSRSWWEMHEFNEEGILDPKNATRLIVNANSVTYKENTPFLESYDEGGSTFFFATWSGGDITVTGYTILDADGNQLYPRAAAAAVADTPADTTTTAAAATSSPSTGDNNMLALFGFLFAISAVGIFVLRATRKVKSN